MARRWAKFFKGHFYVNLNQNSNIRARKEVGLACVDLNGEVTWNTGMDVSFDRGAFILADGMIVAMKGKTGELVLIEADPQEYREKGRLKLFEGSNDANIWAPLALSNGILVARDQQYLKAVKVGRSETSTAAN